MTSQKQIEANRRNALSSTGPKTPKGKARVSRNALKHGLLSHDVLVPGENPKELKLFREAIMADLAPEGELECLLADRVVAAAWRLRRANRLEADVITRKLQAELISRRGSAHLFTRSDEPTAEGVATSTLEYSDTYVKICRYEGHIERCMYRALHELQRLQAARRGRQVTPPMVVDVDVAGMPSDGLPGVSAKQSHSAADEVGGTAEPQTNADSEEMEPQMNADERR